MNIKFNGNLLSAGSNSKLIKDNGLDNEHSIDEFNVVDCNLDDLDLLDGNDNGEDVDV